MVTRSLAIAKRPCDCCIILKSGSYIKAINIISFLSIFAEVTENEHIIDGHLRDIHQLLDYDASESQSYALDLIEIGLSAL